MSEAKPVAPVSHPPTRPLNKQEEEFVKRKWHLSADPSRIRWTEWYGGRLFMPLFTPERRIYGHCARVLESSSSDAKSLSFYYDDRRLGSWYFPVLENDSATIVVEDVLSAQRLALAGMESVALLGVGVSEELLDELSLKRVVWALDADAWARSVGLHNRHGYRCVDSRAAALTKDIKDMRQMELDEWLYSLGI